jgi:hypothetical protein
MREAIRRPSFSWARRAESTLEFAKFSAKFANCRMPAKNPVKFCYFPLLGSSPSARAFRPSDPKSSECGAKINLQISFHFGSSFCRLLEVFASQNGARNLQNPSKSRFRNAFENKLDF